jgi:hypothetical protein
MHFINGIGDVWDVGNSFSDSADIASWGVRSLSAKWNWSNCICFLWCHKTDSQTLLLFQLRMKQLLPSVSAILSKS